jgi:hypothetical protein
MHCHRNRPETRTLSRAPVYHILWVRGSRHTTIFEPGFNLFKTLRANSRATRAGRPQTTLSFSRPISRIRARPAAHPCTISCRSEAFEAIPFPRRDSIFSRRSAPFPGRLALPAASRAARTALSFSRLVSRRGARSPACPCSTSCGFEASAPIPFPRRCDAICPLTPLLPSGPLAPRSRRPKRLGSDRRSAGTAVQDKHRTSAQL